MSATAPADSWPIIVGGCHRSGTSLVRRLLNAHSRIYCGPEVKFFRDFYNDYGQDPLQHLRFATSARAMLSEGELLEVLGRAFVILHERAAAQAGKARWADKNPENVLYLAEWQRLLDDRWALVHVVRNPLDNLASMKEAGFPLTLPPELEARIALYRRYTEAGLSFGASQPARYYLLLYERLVSSPEEELQELMRWLGEEAEPAQLAFNRQPQQPGLEDPKIATTAGVHTESIGRWPAILTPEEARAIWQETEALWSQLDPEGSYRPAFQPLSRRFWQVLPGLARGGRRR